MTAYSLDRFSKLSGIALGASVLMAALLAPLAAAPAPKPLLMTHYMPWFQAKPYSASWGWHWTMNHYNPDHVAAGGRRDAPSHYYPLIGLYDSGDPDALQTQAMLMKMAGINGVIFDWYGSDDFMDYAAVNRNVEKMIPILRSAGLKFAVCYETHTIVTETEGNLYPAAQAVPHVHAVLEWMQAHFFSQPNYLKLNGRPVLLTFGDPYFETAQQWDQVFAGITPKPLYFTEGTPQVAPASEGAFEWPQPHGGTQAGLAEQSGFIATAKNYPVAISGAFSRFDDIYQQAGVQPSYGHIDDQDGQTYVSTLTNSLKSGLPLIQLITWNDWGEGTQIEPSVEFGYRDLEATRRLEKRYLGEDSSYSAADLRLPVQWYQLRKKYAADPAAEQKLAKFVPLALNGQTNQARQLLKSFH